MVPKEKDQDTCLESIDYELVTYFEKNLKDYTFEDNDYTSIEFKCGGSYYLDLSPIDISKHTECVEFRKNACRGHVVRSAVL